MDGIPHGVSCAIFAATCAFAAVLSSPAARAADPLMALIFGRQGQSVRRGARLRRARCREEARAVHRPFCAGPLSPGNRRRTAGPLRKRRTAMNAKAIVR
jgi:hypothetical protein